jgi:hypothetical protein
MQWGVSTLAKLLNRECEFSQTLLPRGTRGQLAVCLNRYAHTATESKNQISRKRFSVP